MVVPPSADLVDALSRRLRDMADLVANKASDADARTYEELATALVEWEKVLHKVKPSVERERGVVDRASPRLFPQSQNNDELAEGEQEGGTVSDQRFKGKSAGKKAARRAAQKEQSDTSTGMFLEAAPIAKQWKLFPPFVLLMRDQEEQELSLKTKGQPQYIKVPEPILRAECPILALLLDRKRTTNIDAADKLAYDPEHTQKLKPKISDKQIYIIAVIEIPFGDNSNRNEISHMVEPNQWEAVSCLAKYITSGPPGKRRFAKPMSHTLKEDLKVLATFLGCRDDMVNVAEKLFEQGVEEKRQQMFLQRKPSMDFKKKA